ncbi:MAG: hypothetical protein IPK72_17165 [Candidatus Eisenbacteria bacterium]|nr:hypothetical protein [Candidatus Eisenbacteria bacterium]
MAVLRASIAPRTSPPPHAAQSSVRLLCLAALLWPASSPARTIHAHPGGVSLGQAIAEAVDGDTVLAAPGIYRGPDNRNLNYLGKQLVVMSVEGPDWTIIDCEEQGRGLYLHSHETNAAIFQGFTIRNGGRVERGGGIYLENHASPTLRDLVLADNEAGRFTYGPEQPWPLAFGGGLYCGAHTRAQVQKVKVTSCNTIAEMARGAGVYCSETSETRFLACRFTWNSPRELEDHRWGAGLGGAIYCARGAALFLDHCQILGNSAYGGGEHLCGSGSGAALYCDEYAHVTIVDSEISENTSCGPAVSCMRGTVLSLDGVTYRANSAPIWVGEWGTLDVTDCVFEKNLTYATAGAVSLWGASARIVSSEFRGNDARTGAEFYGYGGAIQADGADVLISGCAFVGNSAGWRGGAIYLTGGGVTLLSSTVVGNHAPAGGGLYAYRGSVDIIQSVLWGNGPACGSGTSDDVTAESAAAVRVVCSAISPSGIIGEVDFEGPQVTSDPQFCALAPCDSLPNGPVSVGVLGTSPCLPDNNACGLRIGAGLEGCTQRGACCLAGDECALVAPERCADLGGVFLNGVQCLPVPCSVTGVHEALPASRLFRYTGINPIDRRSGRLEFEVQLPRPLPVTAALFDASGRLVRWLHRGEVGGGVRRFEFGIGEMDLPAGVLFLEVRIAGERMTRKVLSLR